MRFLSQLLLVNFSLLLTAAVFAAPVVDIGDTGHELSALSIEQQLQQLKNRLDSLDQQKSADMMAKLQETVQTLQGKVDVLEHDFATLSQEQRLLYLDIDKRKKLESSTVSENNTSSVVSNVGSEKSELLAYQTAYQDIQEKKYGAAATAFQDYLNQYAQGKYVAPAHYWLGELYLLADDKKQALEEFNTVIKQFPKHAKISDARLKAGMIYFELKQDASAKENFDQLLEHYPTSTAAHLAAPYIQKMKSSNRWS